MTLPTSDTTLQVDTSNADFNSDPSSVRLPTSDAASDCNFEVRVNIFMTDNVYEQIVKCKVLGLYQVLEFLGSGFEA